MAGIPVRAVGRERAQPLGSLLATQPAAIALDSALLPEVAGGPVVDAAGRLVGMAQAADGDAPALLVPWHRIAAWLSLLRPGERARLLRLGATSTAAPLPSMRMRAPPTPVTGRPTPS